MLLSAAEADALMLFRLWCGLDDAPREDRVEVAAGAEMLGVQPAFLPVARRQGEDS
jgi:hypothetical protein